MNPHHSVSVGSQQGRPAAADQGRHRRLRLKWRAEAWLPEPGEVMPLIEAQPGARWIVVSARRSEERGWIEVELRPA
jgi:hypothetical protein